MPAVYTPIKTRNPFRMPLLRITGEPGQGKRLQYEWQDRTHRSLLQVEDTTIIL